MQLHCLDGKMCIPSCHEPNLKKKFVRFCSAYPSEFPVSKNKIGPITLAALTTHSTQTFKDMSPYILVWDCY